MHFLVSDFGEFWVPPDEAQVMFSHRLTRDDEIKITDLKGQSGIAVIEGFDKQTKQFRIRVVHKQQHAVPTKVVGFQSHRTDPLAQPIDPCSFYPVMPEIPQPW